MRDKKMKKINSLGLSSLIISLSGASFWGHSYFFLCYLNQKHQQSFQCQ
ncbi:MAG: hypothetical protein L6V81_05735 [Clostridium sp.]|nr:MAG: hypothetical protein L6V81_05735 [Clostridium sp.]